MSLEDKIDALTKAMTENTAVQTKLLGVLGKAGGGAAAGGTTGGTTTAPKTPPKDKAITDEQMRTVFGDYLSSGEAADKPTRKANIAKIVAWAGAELVTGIDAAKRKEACEGIAAFKAGNTPAFLAAEDAGGDDEDDMMG